MIEPDAPIPTELAGGSIHRGAHTAAGVTGSDGVTTSERYTTPGRRGRNIAVW